MKTICAIREIVKAINNFETEFEKTFQISLNEAIVLSTLQEENQKMIATHIARQTNLNPSHASKMFRILEEKGLIVRTIGDKDRRQMFFHLSPSGKQRIEELDTKCIPLPEVLQPLFNQLKTQK